MSEKDEKLCELLTQAAWQGFQDLKREIWYVTDSIVQKLYYLSTNLENACKVLADARQQQGYLAQERNEDLDDLLKCRRQFCDIFSEHMPKEYFRPVNRAKTPPLAGGIATIASSEVLGKDLFVLGGSHGVTLHGGQNDVDRYALG